MGGCALDRAAIGGSQQAGTAQVVGDEVEQAVRGLGRTGGDAGGDGAAGQKVTAFFDHGLFHPAIGTFNAIV